MPPCPRVTRLLTRPVPLAARPGAREHGSARQSRTEPLETRLSKRASKLDSNRGSNPRSNPCSNLRSKLSPGRRDHTRHLAPSSRTAERHSERAPAVVAGTPGRRRGLLGAGRRALGNTGPTQGNATRSGETPIRASEWLRGGLDPHFGVIAYAEGAETLHGAARGAEAVLLADRVVVVETGSGRVGAECHPGRADTVRGIRLRISCECSPET